MTREYNPETGVWEEWLTPKEWQHRMLSLGYPYVSVYHIREAGQFRTRTDSTAREKPPYEILWEAPKQPPPAKRECEPVATPLFDGR
jgi:hypothetical protein